MIAEKDINDYRGINKWMFTFMMVMPNHLKIYNYLVIVPNRLSPNFLYLKLIFEGLNPALTNKGHKSLFE